MKYLALFTTILFTVYLIFFFYLVEMFDTKKHCSNVKSVSESVSQLIVLYMTHTLSARLVLG